MKLSRLCRLFAWASFFCWVGMACAFAVETPAALIPFKHEAPDTPGSFSSAIIGATLFLCALGAALYVIRRRLGPGNPQPHKNKYLRIVETRRLDSHSSLSVIEFGGSLHLIGHTQQNIRCLVSTPGPSAEVTEKPQ